MSNKPYLDRGFDKKILKIHNSRFLKLGFPTPKIGWNPWGLHQGTLTEGEGSVQLTSSLR